jgi:hypothetical protein
MSKKSWINKLALGVACLAVLTPVAAGAQDSFYSWTAPSTEEQVAADQTAIPSGQGAVFVPTVSKAADEPEVLLFAGDDKVAAGRTGVRIPVAPGSYTLRVGSGPPRQMLALPVSVLAGETTIADVTWAGLKIEVVDTQNIPNRGTYEIIRSEDREVFGIGYGADTLQGEPLRTWLLSPGLYRIVRTGETYRARRDFATVFLPEGSLVHFKLVIDPDTGDFRGAGIVEPSEMGIQTAGATSDWTHRATVSGAANVGSTDNFVGRPNQSTIGATVFLDAYSTYENGPHFFAGIFELEEGFVQIDPERGAKLPTQRTQDRLRVDALYTRFINDRWGPYASFGVLTNVFPAETLVTDPISVAFNRLDGSRQVFDFAANEQYETASGFGSLRLREGFGINVRLLRSDRASINWRGGIGFRQNRFKDAFVESDLIATPEIDLFEIDSFNEKGLETVLTGNVRVARRLSYITDLEVFADVDHTGDPTIDWRNTLSLRLSRFLSLDYTYDLLDFPQVTSKTQTRQNLLLRASFDLL